MNTADLITAFFNNEMSPDQERQFLVSVASSDSLRLGLKSHVMLDKILNEQSDITRVSSDVRTNIMREAAVVAAAATGLSATDMFAHEGETKAPAAASGGSRALFSRWLSTAAALLVAVGSFFAGFYTGSETSDMQTQSTAVQEAEAVPERDAGLAPVTVPVTSPALVQGGNENVSNPDETVERTRVAERVAAASGKSVTPNTVPTESAPTAEVQEGSAEGPSAAAGSHRNGNISVFLQQHTVADTANRSDNQKK